MPLHVLGNRIFYLFRGIMVLLARCVGEKEIEGEGGGKGGRKVEGFPPLILFRWFC
jgi:hypothetical protein